MKNPLDFTNPLSFDTFVLQLDKFYSGKDNIRVNLPVDIEEPTSRLVEREMLIAILESAPCGIQIVDNNGIIIYVNDAFLKVVGVSKCERIGKSIYDVSGDGSLASVLQTGKPIFNLRNNPKGTMVELVSSASPIYFNNTIIGAVGVSSDINEVIVLTEQLKKSRSMLEGLSQKISSLTSANYTMDNLIGSCAAMKQVIEMIKISAHNDVTVLIQGETGTGKEIIAQSIHSASARAKKPFIGINCSAIPENLLESEFFGHEKGSFTGAIKTKLGKFELANGGTLFLDEIGDMDKKLQSKILRAIEEKEIQRIGADAKIPLDIRIIAATNRNLKMMVERGEFRQDLYYRLNVLNITLPPLRERKDDIEELCQFMISKLCRKLGRKGITISQNAIDAMKVYNWPGNVRELENVIERVLITCKNSHEIDATDLNLILKGEAANSNNNEEWIMPLEKTEEMIIRKAIKKYNLSYSGKKEIAKALGISLATLYNKLNKYRIE